MEKIKEQKERSDKTYMKKKKKKQGEKMKGQKIHAYRDAIPQSRMCRYQNWGGGSRKLEGGEIFGNTKSFVFLFLLLWFYLITDLPGSHFSAFTTML